MRRKGWKGEKEEVYIKDNGWELDKLMEESYSLCFITKEWRVESGNMQQS